MLSDEVNQTTNETSLDSLNQIDEITNQNLIQNVDDNLTLDVTKDDNQPEDPLLDIVDITTSENGTMVDNEADSKVIEVYHTAIDSSELLDSDADTSTPGSQRTSDTTSKEIEESEKKKANQKQKLFDVMFERFKKLMERYEPLEVVVKSRIRGGLRVIHDGVPMFLPASHAYLKRNPSEEELQNLIGKKIRVLLHELHDDEPDRKTIVVSRRHLLEDELWDKINVGDIVEGRISSVASFGVFVDIGGAEGLIHISRLSQFRIDDPRKEFKKGQQIKAVIIELDKDKNRIGLSRKELEESPWKNIETQFPIDSTHEGTVRRFTNFGAFIELKPGIDGLLRNTELSWTKRIKHPEEILKIDDKITVKILTVSEEKESITLSYKHTMPNPWFELKESYPIGSKYYGTVQQIIPQGIVVELDNKVDGFMPRSKMKSLLKGKKIPFRKGEKLYVTIEELNPEDESLILAPFIDINTSVSDSRQTAKKNLPVKKDKGQKQSADAGSFTLVDLLSDSQKDSLLDSMSE